MGLGGANTVITNVIWSGGPGDTVITNVISVWGSLGVRIIFPHSLFLGIFSVFFQMYFGFGTGYTVITNVISVWGLGYRNNKYCSVCGCLEVRIMFLYFCGRKEGGTSMMGTNGDVHSESVRVPMCPGSSGCQTMTVNNDSTIGQVKIKDRTAINLNRSFCSIHRVYPPSIRGGCRDSIHTYEHHLIDPHGHTIHAIC